jgi:hypothetical protein
MNETVISHRISKYFIPSVVNMSREVVINYVKCGPRISKLLRMKNVKESDKTAVRTSPSQAQVDQLEGWLLEKPIPYISNDNSSQECIFDYWNDQLSGHADVKRTYPDVVSMWRQFHGCPGSGVGIERFQFSV